MAFAGKQTRHI